MESKKIIERAVHDFNMAYDGYRTVEDSERRIVLARYSAAIKPNFIQWLSSTVSSVRSKDASKILLRNLSDEVAQDHPGMLERFCISAGVRVSLDEIVQSTKDLYYISGDVFDRGYATSVRKLSALAVMENASGIFIPLLKDYALGLGATDLEYADVHGIADEKHATELIDALDKEVEAQIASGHKEGFCRSAAKIGARISAEFLANILSPDRESHISI